MRVLHLAALFFAAFVPSISFGITHVTGCVMWTSSGGAPFFGSPGVAAEYISNCCSGFSPAQLPVTISSCTPDSQGPIRQHCAGTTKLGQPAGTDAFGFGPPGAGVYWLTLSGLTYCAVTMEDPKNNGPTCPNCGNPVNIATGNKYQQETDFPSQGEGTLEFTRTYNALNPFGRGNIGAQWSHNYARSLFAIGTTQRNAIRGDGKEFRFVLTGGVWTPEADTPYQLAPSGAQWLLTTPDDEVELYDSTGRLLSITSRSGKVTSFAYSDGTGSGTNGDLYTNVTRPLPAGNLIRATDFRGRTLTFRYNSNGAISQMIDPEGNIYRYNYGTYLVLTSVQYPDTQTRTYVYAESANTSGYSFTYALTGIVDENGVRFATFKYDPNQRAISTEHAGGVEKYQLSYGSGVTTVVDPLGTSRTRPNSTILGFKQVTGTTQTCTGCGGTTTETSTYDSARNLLSYKDFKGNLTCYTPGTRNLEGARTEGLSGTGTCASRVTTSATRTITTDWHPTWRIVKRVAEPLKITSFTYHGETGVSCAPSGAATTLMCSKTVQATTDTDGSAAFSATSDGSARTWSYTYNLAGQVLTVDGPRTDVTDLTTYSYFTADDPSGNYRAGDLASITNAKSQVTQFTHYDASGRLMKSIDPNGLETLLEYWPRGWLKSRKVGTATAGYEITNFDFDYAGQLTKVTQPDGSYVQYSYDNAHRLWKINDGLGNRIEYTLDNMGNRVAEAAYDPSNTIVRAHTRVMDALNRLFKDVGGTNPTGQVTQNGFDANGNIAAILDPLGRTTTQEFDALNRLTAVKDAFNGTSNPTSYQFNRQGALTQVTDPTGLSTSYTVNGHGETVAQVSPDTGTTTFTFDPASNLASKTDARSVSATFTYDELNRVTQITYPDETVNYSYDSCTNGVGRLCSITDRTGTTNYAFDLWGRVTSKSQTVASLTQTIGYAYNSSGQLTTITTPSGRQVVYAYSNNRPVSIAVDSVNVLDSVSYEPFGPNGGWKWGNSTPSVPNTHTRIFDLDFRTTRVTSDLPASGSQPYFDRQVGWDNQSRVASITDVANSALTSAFGYDALDRLTSASQGSNSWGYSYNGIGDRLTTTVNASTTNYAYATGTHRLQTLSGAQSKSFSHDGAGNTTSDGGTTWTYAGNNRPLTAGSLNVLINALGQRVKKDNGSAVTRFVFDEAGRLWGEYDSSGALIQETVWLDDLPVATLRPNGSSTDMFYVHPDHLGTPRAVTRPSDNQFRWKWDNTEAFGNSSVDENPSSLGVFSYNLRFPGQYYDAETGKHYNYFRDYDPAIGRYIQSDPIGLGGGPNTYAYVGGMPLIHFDIWGLCAYMGFTPYPGTAHKWQEVEEKVDYRGGPFPDWKKPGCSWRKFLPPLPGRVPSAGLTPPCKPDMHWEDWDLIARGMRQFSRDYDDEDHIYVCDPKGCNDDGIRHVWQRRWKGDWRVDFTEFTSLDWRRR